MARVLVAEDEKAVARLIEIELDLARHDVTVTHSGPELLEAFPKVKPELVLLDWNMPGMTGIEVLRELRTRGWRNNVRVILVTAKVREADILRGWQAGVDGYIYKPFDVDELRQTVRDVLRATPDEIDRQRREELGRAGLLRTLDEMLDEE